MDGPEDLCDYYIDLCDACKHNEINTVKDMVDENIIKVNFHERQYDILYGYSKFNSLISIAINYGHLELLLERGAKDEESIRECLESHRVDVVKLLVEKGRWYDNILIDAIRYNYSNVIEYLIESGKFTDDEIKKSIKVGNELRNHDMHEEFILAAESNNMDKVLYYLNQGVDIHYKKDLALTKAAYNGNLEMMKYFIDNGADIHTYNDFCFRYAQIKNHINIIEYLDHHN